MVTKISNKPYNILIYAKICTKTSQIIWQYIVIVAEYCRILLVALWSRVLKSPYSHASMRFSVCVQIDVPKQ